MFTRTNIHLCTYANLPLQNILWQYFIIHLCETFNREPLNVILTALLRRLSCCFIDESVLPYSREKWEDSLKTFLSRSTKSSHQTIQELCLLISTLYCSFYYVCESFRSFFATYINIFTSFFFYVLPNRRSLIIDAYQ